MRGKMNKSAMLIIGLTLMISMLICGCPADGALAVKGRIYEWVDAPADAESLIYITIPDYRQDKEEALESMVKSISGNLTLERLPDADIEIGKNDNYYFNLTSDENGEFADGWMVAPSKHDYTIRVGNEGYQEVIGELQQDNIYTYAIIAVLVKENPVISE